MALCAPRLSTVPFVNADIHGFVDLATSIMVMPPRCGSVRLVAVDGPGGSGKSTFARRLSAAAHGAPVIHTDDFASWENEFDWWPRFIEQVIAPLRGGHPARYQQYDWVGRRLAEWQDVAPEPVVIVEGVGAARQEFADALVLAIWVETPADLRLARGIARDGEELRGFWEQWIVGEERHYTADHTRDRANLIVCGNPSIRHDAESEFVALASQASRVE